MSKQMYTAGPWTLRSHNRPDPSCIDENDDWTIYGPKLEMICMEACRNKNAAADARLIACAPELLEALCMLVRCTVTVPGTHALAIDNALAVIAKASGEQS